MQTNPRSMQLLATLASHISNARIETHKSIIQWLLTKGRNLSIGIIGEETKPEVLEEKRFENHENFFAFCGTFDPLCFQLREENTEFCIWMIILNKKFSTETTIEKNPAGSSQEGGL